MPLRGDSNHIYPWREHNDFALVVDGENYFPLIYHLIDQATDYIIIEQYLIESGQVVTTLFDHLVAAAQRGVSVMLLFDDYGAMALNHTDRYRLINNNIQLFFYNPVYFSNWYKNLRRNHRKFICIDGEVGFTGGAGFTDEFDTRDNPEGWHDIQLQINGPVLSDWLSAFNVIWSQYAARPLPASILTAQRITQGDMRGRLSIAHTPRYQEISRSLISRIKTAQHRVWITTPYFIATRKLRREIKRAAMRGVDVRLLLPNTQSDHPWVTHAYRSYYTKLLKSGVTILEYQPRFQHSKIILCDNWVSIGSSNLDRWNRRWSLDANQEIEHSGFTQEVSSLFETDFSNSIEITLDKWQQRSWLKHLQEYIGQKIIFILDSLGNSYRK